MSGNIDITRSEERTLKGYQARSREIQMAANAYNIDWEAFLKDLESSHDIESGSQWWQPRFPNDQQPPGTYYLNEVTMQIIKTPPLPETDPTANQEQTVEPEMETAFLDASSDATLDPSMNGHSQEEVPVGESA